MEHWMDEEAWVESLMTCEAATRFAEEAIYQAILQGLEMRDKTWIDEGIHRDPERQRVWRAAKGAKALAVYRRLQLRLPDFEDELWR